MNWLAGWLAGCTVFAIASHLTGVVRTISEKNSINAMMRIMRVQRLFQVISILYYAYAVY